MRAKTVRTKKMERTKKVVIKSDSKRVLRNEANQLKFKYTFWVLVGLISICLFTWSSNVGIPSDEPIDHAYGEAAFRFYKTLGQDTSYANLKVHNIDFALQKYYGAGFEMPAAGISMMVPSINRFKIRHALVVVSGILIFVFIGLTCRLLLSWATACIATVLLFTSPTIVGNMVFNSKDIPFALGVTISTYFFIRIVKGLPTIQFKEALGAVLGIAIAMSIRVGALVLIGYLGFFILLKLALEPNFREKIANQGFKESLKMGSRLMVISFFGIILGLLFYPNFFIHPFDHVTNALNVASSFPAKIKMLFEGKLINSLNLPFNYLLKSLWITLPIFIWIAIVLSVFYFLKSCKVVGRTNIMFLLFISLFPPIYVIFSEAAIYNGWRHILFFYPSLIIILSISITLFIFPVQKNLVRFITLACFIVLIGKTLLWECKNQPFLYTYYNEFVGGFAKAYDNYDNDYQQLGVSEGVDWLLKNELSTKRDKKVRIISNNGASLNDYYDTTALNIFFQKSGVRQWKNIDWDYAVLSTAFIDPKIRRVVFPPKKTDLLKTITIDGKGIAYVVKRNNKDNFFAYKAIQERKFQEAYSLLLNAIKYDSNNYNAWLNMAIVCNSAKDGLGMLKYAKKYIQLYPNNPQANHSMGIGYFYLKKYEESEKYLLKAIRVKPDKAIYELLLMVYKKSNKPKRAKIVQRELNKLNKKKN